MPFHQRSRGTGDHRRANTVRRGGRKDTARDEVEAALDLIQACPLIMMLLNKVQMSTRYMFGAYSNYYSS